MTAHAYHSHQIRVKHSARSQTAPSVPGMCWIYQDETFLREEMPTTVAELQGETARPNRKKQEAKLRP